MSGRRLGFLARWRPEPSCDVDLTLRYDEIPDPAWDDIGPPPWAVTIEGDGRTLRALLWSIHAQGIPCV